MNATDRKTQFVNVDLDIGPASDIDVLLDELSSRVIVLNRSSEFVSLELNVDPASADNAVTQFAGLIGSLSAEGSNVWQSSKIRRMNIGIQAGVQPWSSEFMLSRQAIAALVEMDCEVVFTVYAVRPEPSI